MAFPAFPHQVIQAFALAISTKEIDAWLAKLALATLFSCCVSRDYCVVNSASKRRKLLRLGDRRCAALVLVGLLVIAMTAPVQAEELLQKLSDQSARKSDIDLYRRGQWEFSLEATYTFHNGPNPFGSLVQGRIQDPNPLHYEFVTHMIAARYRLTNAGGPWFLRGSLEASATLVGSAIVSGPESYFAGFALGLRYDFVQRGARVVPFIEIRGGPGRTDAQDAENTQQQNLVFTFLLSAGLRYDYSSRSSITLSAIDQHLSDFYLKLPNYSVDSYGASVGVFTRF